MAKGRRGIPRTSVKGKVLAKGDREMVALETIYMMELFRDAEKILKKRKQLTSEIQFATLVRIQTFMQVLLVIIKVTERYVAKAQGMLKSDVISWEKEVEHFVEKVYGKKSLQLVTPGEFEKELSGVLNTQKKLESSEKGNILITR